MSPKAFVYRALGLPISTEGAVLQEGLYVPFGRRETSCSCVPSPQTRVLATVELGVKVASDTIRSSQSQDPVTFSTFPNGQSKSWMGTQKTVRSLLSSEHFHNSKCVCVF